MNPVVAHMAVIAALLLVGIFTSRISSQLNMPVLLLFMAAGILFGSNSNISFSISEGSAVQLAKAVGTVAMAFILYSGGLETDVRSIKKIAVPGGLLSTAGVFVTAVLLALGVHFLLRWSWEWCFLLGATVASTDAAAVFSILRSKSVSLRGNLAPLLEFESGSNDPMAALLTTFMISMLKESSSASLWSFAYIFPLKMGIGVAGGIGIGLLGCWLFNHIRLAYEGLYFVLGIAIVLTSFCFTEIVYGNGFMAAYCAGLTMGCKRYNYRMGQIRFNNGLAWLMQVAMFTVLGMLVNFKDLVSVPASGIYTSIWLRGLILAAILMFIARPVAVFLMLIKSQFNLRERLLISWVGLRGAAPIVLATFPLAEKLQGNQAIAENAGTLFNLIFCMVIASVIIQGRTLMPLARLLKLTLPLKDKSRMPLELEEIDSMDSTMHEFEIDSRSPCLNKTLAEIKLPSEARVMLIRRNGAFVMPRGDTVILQEDGLLIMGNHLLMHELAQKYFPGNDFFEN